MLLAASGSRCSNPGGNTHNTRNPHHTTDTSNHSRDGHAHVLYDVPGLVLYDVPGLVLYVPRLVLYDVSGLQPPR
jgi:hypothetical protein